MSSILELERSLSQIAVDSLVKDIIFMKEAFQFFRDMDIERLLYWPEENHDPSNKPFPLLINDAATFRPEKYFSLENQCIHTLETKQEIESQLVEGGLDKYSKELLTEKLGIAQKALATSKVNIDKRCRDLASKVDDFLALVMLNKGECSDLLCMVMKSSTVPSGDVLAAWQKELRQKARANLSYNC